MGMSPADADSSTRYKKFVYNTQAIEKLTVDVFLKSHVTPPREIELDSVATDDPLHGSQGYAYYKCYCYRPLYMTCGDHLLSAKLRNSDRDASALAQGSYHPARRLVFPHGTHHEVVRSILLRLPTASAYQDHFAHKLQCIQHYPLRA